MSKRTSRRKFILPIGIILLVLIGALIQFGRVSFSNHLTQVGKKYDYHYQDKQAAAVYLAAFAFSPGNSEALKGAAHANEDMWLDENAMIIYAVNLVINPENCSDHVHLLNLIQENDPYQLLAFEVVNSLRCSEHNGKWMEYNYFHSLSLAALELGWSDISYLFHLEAKRVSAEISPEDPIPFPIWKAWWENQEEDLNDSGYEELPPIFLEWYYEE